MIYAIIFLLIGIALFIYFFSTYKITEKKLNPTKNDDLVSYYLDFAIKLFPTPLASGIIGILLVVFSLMYILIKTILIYIA